MESASSNVAPAGAPAQSGDQFAQDIFGFAAQMLKAGARRAKVEAALLERGLDKSSAALVLDNLFAARAKALKDAGLKDLITGLLWAVGGVVVTAVTYSLASSGSGGGTYFVAWGAVIFGGYQALRGAFRMIKGSVGTSW